MLEVKNLNMSYGKKEVLQDISFTLKKGRIVGLLGANGAGKSTIMNLLTGFLKPVSGSICIEGTDVSKDPVKAKQSVGYLPEIPPLYKDMKVEEYLFFSAELKKIKDRKPAVKKVEELFHLQGKEYSFIRQLSKGMQQRVGFASALLGDPEILILDEPLVGLDPLESKTTREVLKSLRDQHCILISSHILKEIEELCDDILMLKDGEIALYNTTNRLKQGKDQMAYILVVKGEREKLTSTLEQYEALREVTYISEVEKGVHRFRIVAKDKRDIRDSIFGYLVGKKINIYEITRQETSLEEVYMEINGKEEA